MLKRYSNYNHWKTRKTKVSKKVFLDIETIAKGLGGVGLIVTDKTKVFSVSVSHKNFGYCETQCNLQNLFSTTKNNIEVWTDI